jgi:hypothetical protein
MFIYLKIPTARALRNSGTEQQTFHSLFSNFVMTEVFLTDISSVIKHEPKISFKILIPTMHEDSIPVKYICFHAIRAMVGKGSKQVF